MKNWYNLIVSVLAPDFHKDFEGAPRILSLLESLGDYGSPAKFGFWEPIRTPYTREAALEDWDRTFMWKRMDRKRRQRCEGQLFSASPTLLGGLTIDIASATPIDFPAVEFLETFIDSFEIALGTVHLLAPEESEKSLHPYHTVYYPMSLGYATQDVNKHIPQLTWATLFGPSYVDLIGRDRLLSADAAHRIGDFGDRGVLIQATPDVNDVQHDHAGFHATRQRLKQQIGPEYFYPLPGEPDRLMLAPAFNLSKTPDNPLIQTIEEANRRIQEDREPDFNEEL